MIPFLYLLRPLQYVISLVAGNPLYSQCMFMHNKFSPLYSTAKNSLLYNQFSVLIDELKFPLHLCFASLGRNCAAF